jgi:glucose/arabinose dehydrogenase
MIKKILFSFIIFLMGFNAFAQPNVQKQLIASGLAAPTVITHAGDSRIFVCQQVGKIRIIKNGVLQSTPFLDIQSKIISGGEQGLLGLAFSPNYATDRSFYVYYTDTNGIGNTVVARYKVSQSNPDSAEFSSEQILLTQTQPYTNHNGGCIQFGRDGYLYIALGDGGSGGDPLGNGQNPLTFLGKILRLDVSNTSSANYTIPPDNPFIGLSSVLNEIWSTGWRNPWRFSFDRYTGEMWMGDVGQGLWEEIDRESYGDGGLNYGWRCREGLHTYNMSNCTSTYTDPVYEYGHAATAGCSVTGGYVYRGSSYASFTGYYFYADYCNGNIYALNYDTYTNDSLLSDPVFIPTFGEDNLGELYYANSSGQVYKLVDTTSCLPNATVINTTGVFNCGDSVQFVTPNNSLFTYQWFYNGVAIANATSNSIYADTSGNYSVYVENGNGCGDTSAVYTLGACVPVSINNPENDIAFDIAPNPSSGSFKITLEGSVNNLNYVVTDAIGKTIMSNTMNCDGIKCENNLMLKVRGIYFVLVFDGRQVIAKRKIVVQ